jgi:hypothetical protein
MEPHETRIPISPTHTSHASKQLQIACAVELEMSAITTDVALMGFARTEDCYGESRVRIRRGTVTLVSSCVLVKLVCIP